MAFQLPNLPSFQTNIPAPPNPVDAYAKMLQLKGLQSSQALQQQLAPLQVQEQQQRVQGGQTENALKDIQLRTAQAENDYWSHPDKYDSDPNKEGATDDYRVERMLGIDPADPVAGMVRGMIKAGVPGPVALHYGQSSVEFRKTANQATQEQQKVIDDAWTHMEKIAAPIMAATDPEVKAQLIAQAKPSLNEWAAFDPSLKGIIPQLNVQNFDAFANRIGAQKEAHDFTKGIAETRKSQLEVAPPSADQLATFTDKTIPSFASLRPEQKNAFIAEAKTARTVDELNKVVERADSTDKAEQMHADSLAQTAALKGQTFGQQGLKENDKTWTDPQHGYLQTLSQANLGKAAIKAGADGNGLLTSLEPTMAVLGMNSFAGVHRISPAEAQAAGAPGGWAERFSAWASKAATGKLSDQLAKEGNQLFDQIIDSKYQASLQASKMHAQGYNIPAQNLPVMTKEGDVTTLDKVGKVASPKAAEPFHVPAGAPNPPKEDGHQLKMNGQVIAVSKGGQWAAP
jgi:hypothetical protein